MSLQAKAINSNSTSPRQRLPLIELIRYQRLGRPKAVPDTAKPALTAQLDKAALQGHSLTIPEIKAAVCEAAKDAYTNRHDGQDAPAASISERTLQRALYEDHYYKDGHRLLRVVKTQTENERRHEAERDGRNGGVLAYYLHQYANNLREECIMNADSMTMPYEGSRAKPYRAISEAMYQYNLKNKIHLKVLPEEGSAKGFDAKLMTASSAAGICLPFVLVLQNNSIPANTVRPFELKGFAPDGKAMGYAVIVQSTKGTAMTKVFDWYFTTVVLPHIDSIIAESTNPEDANPNFLFTFDGETPQLQSLDSNLLKQFEERNVTVMKLPASFSAVGQPSDVAVCYSMLRLLVKQYKNYGILTSYLQRSFEALQDMLAADASAASWRDTFLNQLEICLKSMAPNLAVAFAYPNIVNTFRKMAWCPAGNPKPIFNSIKGITQDTVKQMLDGWPKLLALCKSDQTINEARMTAVGWPAWDSKGELVTRPLAVQQKIDESLDKRALSRLRAVILVTAAHDNFIAKLRVGKSQRKAARPSMPEQKKATQKRKRELAEQKRQEKQEATEKKEAEKQVKKAKKAEEEVEKRKRALDREMNALVRLSKPSKPKPGKK